jgi:hypothetical protein
MLDDSVNSRDCTYGSQGAASPSLCDMYALPGGYGRDLCVYTFCPLLFTLSPERREGSTIERLPHERGGANDERKKKKCI